MLLSVNLSLTLSLSHAPGLGELYALPLCFALILSMLMILLELFDFADFVFESCSWTG